MVSLNWDMLVEVTEKHCDDEKCGKYGSWVKAYECNDIDLRIINI